MNTLKGLLLAYLLNALWQVPLFFAGAALAASALRKGSPRLLHRIWVTTLLLQALFPLACLAPSSWFQSLTHLLARSHHDQNGNITLTFGPASILGQSLPTPFISLLLYAYLLGTAWVAIRLLLSLRNTFALQRDAIPAPLPPELLNQWTRICRHFNIQNAFLATSPRVHTPLTLGVRRKIILLPSSLLSTLTPPDLDTILAHECAHMQRNDFALNLFYECLTLPIAFHPLFWLTKDRVTETREWICDNLAAAALQAPQTYARSLLHMATLILQARSLSPTTHALGIFDANSLERRIMYLTRKSSSPTLISRFAAITACTAMFAATCASAWAFHTAPATPEQQAAPAPEDSVHVSAGVIAGNLVTRVNPVYPPDAKAAGIQGSVVLRAVISKTGVIESLNAVSGPPELAGAAIDAVRQWIYKPYTLNGEPTEVETTITVNFQLAR